MDFDIFGLIMRLLPHIIAIIKEIEAAIPKPGMGAQKLALAQSILKTGAEASNEQPLPDNVSAALISSLVTAMNATGEFKK